MKQKKVAVLFGGTNTEHEVSIVSAKSIIQNLDKSKYAPLPLKIKKDNTWVDENGKQVDPFKELKKVDIAFPVLHGPFGEDGTTQGLFEMVKVPYVGCGVLASAVCMDKVVQKQICQTMNIPIPKYFWFTKALWKEEEKAITSEIEKSLQFPVFVKPANQGSSVGISKVDDKEGLKEAIEEALKLDLKVIVEQNIPDVREIECSVMGNDNPKASVLGEIVPSNDFYDYNAKYIDGKSKEVIPAKLEEKMSIQIRQTALEAYELLGCSGLARVDFLYDNLARRHYLNELNTMPGFTSISMYPKLWKVSGIEYPQLVNELITLGFQRHEQRSEINYNYKPKTDWHKK
ncbi:D-alanine--D-alanine ligase family protein [Patescibacteria group bacterium]